MANEKIRNLRPLIFWEGFPPCGLLIKHVADEYGEDLKILGTRAAVPFEGLEEMLGHKIEWLSSPDDIWDRREEFSDRNFIIHTGWRHKGWLRYDRWIKKRGAKVVVTLDNIYEGSARQFLGAIWFRLWLRYHFDAAFVPGKASTRFMRFLGLPANKIFTGYYGAYEEIYYSRIPLIKRPKEFLFIGQLIKRKGVDILLRAFEIYKKNGGTWELRIAGIGPLEHECKQISGVHFEGFVQALRAAELMRNSRCVLVPSREDHWATVVCEAMACGALVIASKWVGAAEDLIQNGINGFIFNEMTSIELAQTMFAIEGWDDERLSYGGWASLNIAKKHGSKRYFESFNKMACKSY